MQKLRAYLNYKYLLDKEIVQENIHTAVANTCFFFCIVDEIQYQPVLCKSLYHLICFKVQIKQCYLKTTLRIFLKIGKCWRSLCSGGNTQQKSISYLKGYLESGFNIKFALNQCFSFFPLFLHAFLKLCKGYLRN